MTLTVFELPDAGGSLLRKREQISMTIRSHRPVDFIDTKILSALERVISFCILTR
jgi:hypothetical protein